MKNISKTIPTRIVVDEKLLPRGNAKDSTRLQKNF